MSEPFRITRRVEFGETDQAGIVHFSNFFRYMESAETAFLRSRGLSVSWKSATGERFGFPRVSASCDYVVPARFEDLLTIEVEIERIGSKSVTYRFGFFRDGQKLATGKITSVFCRKSGDDQIESLDLTDEIRKQLAGSIGE
ncbi:acyl-CoA thioesterase [Tuwongella immobilis]|uniref:Thioesterase domain-containing protein n=1 Tax=Tuwongella immobilis TaxID=692036 RepID=A0A6C2YNA9_9BACT|nr:thioesterase family protein [Tuwongella immobilis]VIP02771.1 4-hydroxybenzoyl- thioesterase : Thioesterase superfamily protein OS=Rhodopirellula baltica SH28 GN=RBSH_05545 PE=4 SV=1: 4HBT [Tuwongella immobilis]VTS02402.1 4-hydroxybenzoyl- thioesterase : Thioesterase superfamily protein OS=Rhodopirellula baltica SH28 GN=RBSH_05545 PE=4 SV=1: 4HBT [Tuwongella immobilis]